MHRILICFTALLSGCIAVTFQHPQPPDAEIERKFPDFLLGKYLYDNSDTLTIRETSFSYGKKGELFNFDEKLSDNILLKKHSGFYFLNFKNDSLWTVYGFKQNEDKDMVIFTIDIDGENREVIDRLKTITDVRTTYDDSGEINGYIIDPSVDQLDRMLAEHVFNDTAVFRKITK